MYLNLLYLPLFSIAYLFVLSFLSSQRICQFSFYCFILHMAPCFSFVFQFVLQLVSFLTGTYNFLFPFFARSIYCTLCLLDCFDFAYGCVCICVYSVKLFIVVINLCLYIGLLQFCGVFLFFPPLLLILIFLNLLLVFLHLFLCLLFLLFFSPCS